LDGLDGEKQLLPAKRVRQIGKDSSVHVLAVCLDRDRSLNDVRVNLPVIAGESVGKVVAFVFGEIGERD
jgi:hypothetical protein